ncbi:peptidase inhibitor family I36 protein [Streptomyces cynarae]|uniref:Peptidase inhibitor family I36 protein n=1 Tax=Streptomyces cynarae TaxID=2981134 RepID=A0ABY6DSW0_9ACTN|nr:peptidase inhibitor family I36 protein [Streptomyces cynarae]UXY17446.1 peptidase inhibitor family I36 protein [Streptomyces cynarae]
MRLLPPRRPRTGRTALLAAVPAVLAASLTGLAPAHATTTAGAPAVARDQITCPRGFVCIYPDINFNGQPYVKRAVDGSVRHLPDYIRSKGSSIINNSSRTARVYQKGQLLRPARLRRTRGRYHQRPAFLPAQRHHSQPAQRRHPLRRLVTALNGSIRLPAARR